MAYSLISRKEWGARDYRCATLLSHPVPNVFIHHAASGVYGVHPFEDDAAQVRAIQNYHMGSRGWCDAAYSFAIAPSGRVFVLRGWDRQPGATRGWNHKSVAVCFLGDYNQQSPTTAALNACRWLIHDKGKGLGKVANDAKVLGHRDVGSTACPGNNLYDALPLLRKPLAKPKQFVVVKGERKTKRLSLKKALAKVREWAKKLRKGKVIRLRRVR